jgi:uncharacterized protein YidB (DUF937 family)
MILAVATVLTIGLTVANAQETPSTPASEAVKPTSDARPGRLIKAVAEVLGVEPAVVAETLASGGTIAELASSQGVSIEELVEALVARLTERLEQAVAEGKIDDQRAARLIASAPQRIERLIANPVPDDARRATRSAVLEIISERLGLSPNEIKSRLRSGASLAELASEQGVSADELVEALVGPRRDRITRAVATGRIPQEEADQRLAELIARISERINGRAGG